MKVLLQRSLEASVHVDNKVVGEISSGLVFLIGIQKHDCTQTLIKMADKLLAYRVFSDNDGKMNLNVQQVKGGVLAISQFTLAADTNKGLRPSFSSAAPPALAETLYHEFLELLRERHTPVAAGVFAADMKVSLINDGPVTFLLET